jgi:TPR repeat protein
MRYVLEERRHESDPQSQRMLDREYLSLVERKLAYEQALLGLAQVYAGGQGASHANPQLALKYLRLGAAYGFPSSQRVLGLVILSGSLGARRSELEGRRWLYAAAAKGDRVAVRWLTELDKSSAANRMGEPFPRS